MTLDRAASISYRGQKRSEAATIRQRSARDSYVRLIPVSNASVDWVMPCLTLLPPVQSSHSLHFSGANGTTQQSRACRRHTEV